MNLIFLSFTLLSVGKYAIGTNTSTVSLTNEFELYIQSTYAQLGSYYAKVKEHLTSLDRSIESDEVSIDESTISIYETLLNKKEVKELKKIIRDGIANGRKLAKCNHMLNQKITHRVAEFSELTFGELRPWLKAKSVLEILLERPRIDIESAISIGAEAANYHLCDDPDIFKGRIRGYHVSDTQLLDQMLNVYEANYDMKRSKVFQNFNEHAYDDLESLVFAPRRACSEVY